MQKAKVICIVLAVLLVSGGAVLLVSNLSGNANIIAPPPSDSVSATMEKPSDGVFVKNDAINNLYIAHGELIRSGGFKGVNQGTSVSMGITQQVYSNRTVVGNNVFKQSVSDGMVKMGSQTYIWGDNFIFRDVANVKSVTDVTWKNTARKVSKSTYDETYGYHFAGLTGYILNDKTILNAELEKEENGIYTYRYTLDIELAPYYVLYEMRTNAGTKGFATFTKAEIVVEMDENWIIKTLSTDCKYKVPMLGGVPCEEHMTETFSDYGYSGDLPEKEFFEPYLDAEISEPEVKEPDVTSALMEMFEPYLTGEKLNVALNVSNMGENIVSAKISANIDINNLENITADVEVGGKLFLSYGQGKLYVTYGDFKGSTTIDGVAALIKTLIPQSETSGLNINAEELLKSASFKTENGERTVSLPISLGGGLSFDVVLRGKLTGECYVFCGAEVTYKDVKATLSLCDGFDVPAVSDDYPEILGLADVIKDGVISANIKLADYDAKLSYNINSSELYLKAGALTASLQDGTAYLSLGNIKLKAALFDVGSLAETLKLVLGDKLPQIQMPTISLAEILSALNGITATATQNGTEFSLKTEQFSVCVRLLKNAGRWTLGEIAVSSEKLNVSVTPDDGKAEFPEINAEEYADVTDIISEYAAPLARLIASENYKAEFFATLNLSDSVYGVTGELLYCKNGGVQVNAVISGNGKDVVKADVTYTDGRLYLTLNGIKAAFNVGGADFDFKRIISAVYGKNQAVDALIDKFVSVAESVENLDVSSLNIAEIVESFDFTEGVTSLKINGESFGLGSFGVSLKKEGIKLVASIDGFNFAGVTLNAEAKLCGTQECVAEPRAEEYVLNLKGSVSDVGFALSADFLNMDINAEITIGSEKIAARFVDNVVYVKVGNAALSADVQEIGALVNRITQLLPQTDGVTSDSLDILKNIDLNAVLQSITFDVHGEEAVLSAAIGNIIIQASFDGELALKNVLIKLGGNGLIVAPSAEQINKLDVSGEFVKVSDVADQLFAIFEAYRNAAETGVSGSFKTDVKIDGKTYAVNAEFSYNKGLRATAAVSDGKKLINAELYYVNGVIYLNVNGFKCAYNTANNGISDKPVDTEAIFAALQNVKGCNAALDSVIDVLSAIPQKLKTLNYLNLIGGLYHKDGETEIVVNGAELGLNKFSVIIKGKSDLSVVVDSFVLGGITAENTVVNVTPHADTVSAPNVSSYVTEVQIDAMGITVYAKLDLFNGTVTATSSVLGEDLDVSYQNGFVYVVYGGVYAKLDVKDVGGLLSVIGDITGKNIEFDASIIDVKQILGGLTKETTENGFVIRAALGSVNVEVAFDNDAVLSYVNVVLGSETINVKLYEGAEYKTFDTEADYVDLAELTNAFAGGVKTLLNAKGYFFNLNGSVAFGSDVYAFSADVNYNGGLRVDATLSYNGVNVIKGSVYLVKDVLYLDVDGVKLAVNVGGNNNTGSGSWQDTVKSFYGYNGYVDKLLDLILNVAASAKAEDIPALLDGITFDGNCLNVRINGAVYGLSAFNVSICKDLNVELTNLTYQDITLNLRGSVSASGQEVVAPQGDYSTNLQISVDSLNTIYANLNLLTGVYRVRLDNLNVMYAYGTIRINYDDQLLIKTNLAEIDRIIKQFNELAGDNAQLNGGLSLGGIDLKALAQTLSFVADLDNNSAELSALISGIKLTVKFFGGENPTFQASLPVDALGKTFVITPDEKRDYCEFTTDESKYVAIEQVIDDYFPTLEKLAKTKAWHFDLSAQIDVKNGDGAVDSYLLRNGSYVEFIYDKVQNEFNLRVKIDVAKRINDNWNDFMTLELAFFDGRIYVDYNGLKISISVDAIKSCITDNTQEDLLTALKKCLNTAGEGNSLVDRLFKAIPQIQTALDDLKKAQQELNAQKDLIKYADILKKVSYANGVFEITVNGKIFMSDLSDITLAFSENGDALRLEKLELTYGGVSVTNVTASVTAKDKAESKAFISSYDTAAYHINLDSIKELLSAFVNTADDKAFYIDGNANVDINILIHITIDIGLAVKVDIDDNGDVFISAKISRENSTFYSDKGGFGYLYYNGALDKPYKEGEEAPKPFTIVRNSYLEKDVPYEDTEKYYYCTECGKEKPTNFCATWGHWSNHMETRTRVVTKTKKATVLEENNYYANVSTADFTANIIDYIFELVNFSDTIEKMIKDQITKENTNEFGIEDIIKDYKYEEVTQSVEIQSQNVSLTGKFALSATLKPISGALGDVGVNIYHDSNYELRTLDANMKLLGGIGTVNLNMALQSAVYGNATDIVKGGIYW